MGRLQSPIEESKHRLEISLCAAIALLLGAGGFGKAADHQRLKRVGYRPNARVHASPVCNHKGRIGMESAINVSANRVPWNKGKLVGRKPPLKQRIDIDDALEVAEQTEV
jgi:hypothetical protein